MKRVCFILALFSLAVLSNLGVAQEAKKKIVFIAGGPSHDYGSHEHYAGCRILADTITKSMPNVECEVIRNGWPADDKVLDSASTIVIYSDGGGGHPANAHLDRLAPLMAKGVGFVCIHYGVEVPKGKEGDRFLEWLGGYFETHWSVNPHWTADFKELPKHPITSGVSPFQANDEWYFHMRFRPNMEGVTPILSAIAPASTMERGDGPHSGNPDVRKAVAKGEPQHTAWAFERPKGGRSFGFTGGHFHWNWGRPEIRKLVANAIVWSTGLDVPKDGLSTAPLGVDKLQENQDEQVPGNFSPENIKNQFKLTSTGATNKDVAGPKPRQLYSSPVVNATNDKHQIDISANIKGVKKLFLVVTDGGDGFTCDWADWIEPKLVGPKGTLPLTDLKWVKASSQWGEVRKNANAGGQPLSVKNKSVGSGIGTHANSIIEFDLPEGYEKLEAQGGLDSGGTNQNVAATSVQFHVFADAAPTNLGAPPSGSAQREPENAVAGLKVHAGVEVTLAASEPTLKSLTNLDIDDRGRIWVCEVVNYRRHNGERPEGDRILILEDTNNDGVTDTSKVFYQGREIDSAMGICVLGDKVIVSAAPNVWVFTDANGDDVPEKKEAVFTKTGQPQHDHSNHSFVFGPDGKLYWNFGNTGKAMFDRDGKPVLDRWGREINDSGKPYRQGMAFRCNLDFSDMEVLGHNFRNNYELAVDSFGSVWQSDNDDDGNRATRINYVMEFGNFGYTDEFTGEAWQAERTGWESEIPKRHWHLNDPGVVPTTLITGAGSPTGITVYEGRLLPEAFWDQVIHCDAGPNVVRAYPATAEGAGFSATILDLIVGEKDKWFRPADACVAPDGSIYVTDWYDPGVGGHNMEDMERGRLFRVAPPNAKYTTPKFDYATAEGAAEALKSPAQSVRFKAWMALHGMGAKATPVLTKLMADKNPRTRARALWLLGKISGEGTKHAMAAMSDPNSDIRITAIRIARQNKVPIADYVFKMAEDKSPSVLRELALALREDKSPEMPRAWGVLAKKYDGKDRWYLEALGIGATDRWQECIQLWLETVGNNWHSPEGKGILWRARTQAAADKIADFILEENTKDEELSQLMRGLDFQSNDDKANAWKKVLETAAKKPSPRNDRLVAEAAMKTGDASNPKAAEAIKRYLASLGNDPSQLKVIRQLKLEGQQAKLLDLASTWGADSSSVQAIDIAMNQGATDELVKRLTVEPITDAAKSLAKAVSLSNRKDVAAILEKLLTNEKVDTQIKIEASQGLARTVDGQRQLIALAKDGKLPGEAKVLVGPNLRNSNDEAIRTAATELFPARKTSQAPLPPVDTLAKRQGNVEKGLALFTGVATCAQCHQVNGQGKNVGPDLSEIGNKLSREAMYVSILEPSAGISHNYEAFMAVDDAGDTVTGLLVNQAGDEVTIRDAKSIERTFKKSELESFKKSEKSLMPEGLQELMTEEGLVDLVEYLTTLKKKK